MGRFAVMTMTDAAASRVRDIMSANPDALGVRVGVKKGGCAGDGIRYRTGERARPLEDVVEHEGAKVFVAPDAVLYLLGTQMDFEQTTLRTGFTFQNPNQTSAAAAVKAWNSLPHRLPH